MVRLSELWRRCVDAPSDEEAWGAFLLRSRGLLEAIARNAAARRGIWNPADIQDIFQEICLKLAVQARSHPLVELHDAEVEAYLKKTAANAAIDYLRARNAQKRDERLTLPVELHVEELQSQTGLKELENGVLRNELEALVEGDSRERSVFLLYYKQGLRAREIAAIPWVQLDTKGVENLLARMARVVREKLHRRVGKERNRASL